MKEVKMPKQTAIEYLIQELKLNESMYKSTKDILDKALAMEKEQIESAFNQGDLFSSDYFDGKNITSENYYNETYGGNNE